MPRINHYQTSETPRTTTELLLKMVAPYKLRTSLFFLLTFLGNLAWTGSPLVIAATVTRLGKNPAVDSEIWTMVGIYAALRLFDELAWRIAEVIMRSYKPQMIESVRTNLFAATLKKPHRFFVNSSSGRIGHWINQTTSTTNEFVDTTIWTVWGRLVSLVIAAVFLLFAHWSLAALFVVWLALLFMFNAHRGKYFSHLVADESNEISKVSGTVVDTIGNNLSVRVHNAQHREQTTLADKQQEVVWRWRRSWRHHIVTNAVKGHSAVYASVGAFGLVVYLYSHSIIELGDIVLFIAYFGDASSSLWQLAWSFDSYFRNYGTIQNALDGLSGTDEPQSPPNTRYPIPKQVGLELVDLSFSYPEQPEVDVLAKLNLTIPAAQKVGLVGHSGAGKSTLIGLLLGLFEPSSGNILVNGEDALKKEPSALRAISTYVPQDTQLFNRTIGENVAYGKPGASKSKLRQALKQAQALGFVEKLPDGLDTLIGERGVKLSGGQRQRVAIARAILQDAPLVLLDEATSALDSVSEQAIQKALHKLMHNRTAIVIAHRLSTLKHLDMIVVIQSGKIIEQGSHQQLLARDGVYADLWRRQKDGFIAD